VDNVPKSRNGKTLTNKHHLLWIRLAWDDGSWRQELRRRPELIIELPVDIHERLHAEVGPIPVPTKSQAKGINKQFFPTGEWRIDLRRLIKLCSDTKASKTAKALRRQYKFLCTHMAGL